MKVNIFKNYTHYLRRPRIRRLFIGLAAAAVLLALPATVSADPLWGVDEDDGQLFSLNLDTFAMTDYGNLLFNDGGSLREIGEHIEAFAIDITADTAYFAVNNDVGGIGEPVLMSLDLNAISMTSPNVANIVGAIDIGFDNSEDNITGLSFDSSGLLYALFRDDSEDDTDSLLVIDQNTGNVLENRGEIISQTLNVAATSAEDMVFGAGGNLYVTDDRDEHLYQIDPLTGAILSIVDAAEEVGVGDPIRIEALAFDPLNSFLLAADDEQDRLIMISLADGGNTLLTDLGALGLTDVEGFAWNPAGVPEPAPLAIALLGLAIIAARRPRRRIDVI